MTSLGTLPAISVIVVVKNGAEHLAQSLASIVGQEHPPAEVLVIDNQSTDGTGEIARQFAAVRYLRNDPELGIAEARNLGIRLARYDLLAFNSHDDLWLPGKLRLQAQCFQAEPKLEICISNLRCFLEPGQLLPASFRPELVDADVPGWVPETLLARRSAFERIGVFDSSFAQCDDTEWFVRARHHQLAIRVLEETLVLKRLRGTSVTYGPQRARTGQKEMLEIARRALAQKRGNATN